MLFFKTRAILKGVVVVVLFLLTLVNVCLIFVYVCVVCVGCFVFTNSDQCAFDICVCIFCFVCVWLAFVDLT